jgi:DNA-binding NtrC family response regulator/tetratricopeptide (TPR) repeat protein
LNTELKKLRERYIRDWAYIKTSDLAHLEIGLSRGNFSGEDLPLCHAKLAWCYLGSRDLPRYQSHYTLAKDAPGSSLEYRLTMVAINASNLIYTESDFQGALNLLDPISEVDGPVEYMARIYDLQGAAHLRLGKRELAEELFEKVRFTIDGKRFPTLLAHAHIRLGIHYAVSMEIHLASKAFSRAIACLPAGEYPELEQTARFNSMIMYRKLGELTKANTLRSSIQISTVPEVKRTRFYNEFTRISLALENGSEARVYLRKIEKWTGEGTPLRSRIISKEIQADYHRLQGEWQQALDILDDGLEMAYGISKQNDLVGEILRRRARALYELERDQEAFDCAREALKVCEQVGEVYEIGALFRTLGLLAERRQELNEAENLLLKAVEFYRERDEKWERAHSHREIALFYRRIHTTRHNDDDLRESFRHAASALGLFDEMGVAGKQTEMQTLCDELTRLLPSTPFTPPEGHELVEIGDRFGIITGDITITRILETLVTVAPSNTAILITGETGTGKELFAHAAHTLSPRCDNPLVIMNCAAIPGELMESELFGHLKGSFTGAHKDRLGKFAQADTGTLFLDEIGDLSPGLQAKLLRVLQDGVFTPVGSDQANHADVRIISATNHNLEQLVKAREFRQDLLYRLNHVTLTLPPLRDRGQDVELLALYFLHQESEHLGRNIVMGDHALDKIRQYPWPGNVRELKNFIRRIALFARETGRFSTRFFPESYLTPLEGQGQDLATIVLNVEREAIINTMARMGGNRSAAARELGISRSTMNEKIRRYNLTDDFHERINLREKAADQ